MISDWRLPRPNIAFGTGGRFRIFLGLGPDSHRDWDLGLGIWDFKP